ncbi:hypothetical protein RB195_021062 [Necator americanus]|uniref:Uncharacterized protein n=1 Tax=Necator americanus TaxID=51031 RepID=A0ABR1E9T6_NECAM
MCPKCPLCWWCCKVLKTHVYPTRMTYVASNDLNDDRQWAISDGPVGDSIEQRIPRSDRISSTSEIPSDEKRPCSSGMSFINGVFASNTGRQTSCVLPSS